MINFRKEINMPGWLFLFLCIIFLFAYAGLICEMGRLPLHMASDLYMLF